LALPVTATLPLVVGDEVGTRLALLATDALPLVVSEPEPVIDMVGVSGCGGLSAVL